STTMLTTMSLTRATSAGVAWALAPCCSAQPCALPGVCVQTFSSNPARATLAAMREPMIPSPRNPMRSPAGIAPSSTTGRFDAQPLRRLQPAGDLAGERAPVSAPGAAARARRPMAAALSDQREVHRLERLQLAHDAVAAAVPAGAAGAAPQRVLDHAQREFALERLDGRVQRV